VVPEVQPLRTEDRLKQIVCEVVEEKGACLVELATRPDHVHLLVDIDPATVGGVPLSVVARYVEQQKTR
jgi:REP element-mobilizing transposase RayT